jgi:AcrR family transcriptional regulator/transposase
MARGRHIATLQLSAGESRRLLEWTRQRNISRTLGLRARIILACARGLPNSEVAAETGTTQQTVGKWRRRFVEGRLDGLLDEPRSGAPQQVAEEVVKAITRTLGSAGAALPSTRGLARELNVSQTTVSRILRSLNLQSGSQRGKNNSQRTYDSAGRSEAVDDSMRRRLSQRSTRDTILAAAQQAFSEPGYSQASIRDIAAMAGVSSTLLLHYFGSKAALFQAALSELIPAGSPPVGLTRDRFGERLSHVVLDAKLDLMSPSMIVLAVGNAEARDITIRVTTERIFGPLAKWLGPPNAEVRAVQILMLSMGLVFYTRQLPVLSPALRRDNTIRAWFAESIQAIVDNSLPAKGRSKR